MRESEDRYFQKMMANISRTYKHIYEVMWTIGGNHDFKAMTVLFFLYFFSNYRKRTLKNSTEQ